MIDRGLRCSRHYGKTRLSDISEIASLDVVLTTYHTVSSDWHSGKPSLLFSVDWRRIILDEGKVSPARHIHRTKKKVLKVDIPKAHVIRNESSRISRAVCDLDATARWAVTGTPISNRLDDLATLLKFIRVDPYTDSKRFKSDISVLWKSGEDEEAVRRLKYLSACLLLRRPKKTITLPARRDLQCPVDFSNDERATYQDIRDRTITKIDDALHKSSDASKAGAYVNILQQIESL